MTSPKPSKGRSADDVIPVSASKEARNAPDNDPPEETLSERIGWGLARVQVWAGWVLLLGGVLAWLVLDWVRGGLGMMGGALILSGLVPLLTAYYRSALGVLQGWKARARGLVSLVLGVLIVVWALVGN